MAYDLNRTGGHQLSGNLSHKIDYRPIKQKELDDMNSSLKVVPTVLGGLVGASVGAKYARNHGSSNYPVLPIAVGGLAGGGTAFLFIHLLQKLGQTRARRMLRKIKQTEQAEQEKTAQAGIEAKKKFLNTYAGRTSVSAGAGALVGLLYEAVKKRQQKKYWLKSILNGALGGAIAGAGSLAFRRNVLEPTLGPTAHGNAALEDTARWYETLIRTESVDEADAEAGYPMYKIKVPTKEE